MSASDDVLRRPLVGLAAEDRTVRTTYGETTFLGARAEYLDAVAAAGGLPVVLPFGADVEQACASVDAIVLTGGGDVAPARYGAADVPELEDVSAARDAFELALVRAALAGGLPVLAICRGLQVLNVAAGGTLVPHLDSAAAHNDPAGCRGDSHGVVVAEGSALYGVVGTTRLGVNTLHHQAVAAVGTGLTACAWSEDGIVEALESPGAPVLGVQWHPELRPETDSARALFGWLVTAARARLATTRT